MNLEEIKEQRYADRDPQFAEEKEIDRDELFDSALYDILDDIYEAREILKKAKGKIKTRKFNELDRLLGEAEDKADELLEKGL